MVDKLTPMQRSCITCCQEGLTNREIAARLGIAESTVANHLGRAYERLGLMGHEGARTRAAVLLWCAQHETHAARLVAD